MSGRAVGAEDGGRGVQKPEVPLLFFEPVRERDIQHIVGEVLVPLLCARILVVSSKPLQIAQRDFGVCFMCV